MDYRPIIESKYNRENWQRLLHDIFNGKEKFWNTPSVVPTNSQFAKQALWLGTITLSDGQTISIYEVVLADSVDIERNRRGIRDMLLTAWRSNGNAGAFRMLARHGHLLRMGRIRKNRQIPNASPICLAKATEAVQPFSNLRNCVTAASH